MSLCDFPKEIQNKILELMYKEKISLLRAENIVMMQEINKLREKNERSL